jgi:hypothetical protein
VAFIKRPTRELAFFIRTFPANNSDIRLTLLEALIKRSTREATSNSGLFEVASFNNLRRHIFPCEDQTASTTDNVALTVVRHINNFPRDNGRSSAFSSGHDLRALRNPDGSSKYS